MLAFRRRAFAALAFCSMAPLLTRAAAAADDAPDLGGATLERSALVRAVLARNPSARLAEATLRAAAARAEAAGALADPSLEYALAPRSLGGRAGQRAVLSQPLTTFGKRGLAREAAGAEADASALDAAAVRLDLALAASQLFDDHYLAARSLRVNARHRGLVEDLRQVALARYEAGGAPRQAPLAAELEAARLVHREVELHTLQRITAAELNALLQRPSDAALPPPPETLALAAAPSAAAPERPELRAADARLRASEAALRLARRERIPNLTLLAGYDGMWEDPEMRPMIGVELAVPLSRTRRRAAIAEADALRDAAREERRRVDAALALKLAIARERLAEAQHSLAVIREQMLPAARDQAEAAAAALEAGRGEFAGAIEAERAWYETELEAEQALVAVSRRAAELARAEGRALVEDSR